MDYNIRSATPEDRNLIYALHSQSVRPYVEKIWGWDEGYQQKDFDRDFSHIEQFKVIEMDGRLVGFVQTEETDTHYILEWGDGMRCGV